MSATQRQDRRGTKANHDIFAGAEGEITVDTTNDRAVVHDGVKLGGYPAANAKDLMTRALTEVTATGTDDYIATFPFFPDNYITGMRVSVKFTNANTDVATININGVGEKDLLNLEGDPLVASDIEAASTWELEYNGVAWQLYLGAGGGNSFTPPEIFTASGTWTKPAGASGFVKITVVGSGGGADGGSNGSTSSFGAHCSATGGTRGNAVSSGGNLKFGGTSGGSGGIGSGGDLNLRGSRGGSAAAYGEQNPTIIKYMNGHGGNSPVEGYGEGTFGSNGSGGGGGGAAIKWIDVDLLGVTETVTVGSNNDDGVVIVEYLG